jgi:hypothetical protein
MPGPNPQQAALINATELAVALQGFALVPSQILAKQNALLAELVAKNFKKESIFKTGTGFDFGNKYLLQKDGSNASRLLITLSAGANLIVQVLPIFDADKVRLTFFTTGVSGSAFLFFYALSPNDATNPIDPSQFAMLTPTVVQQEAALGIIEDEIIYDQVIDEILPVAGNKYLHLTAFAYEGQGNDYANFWDFYLSQISEGSPGLVLTYELRK